MDLRDMLHWTAEEIARYRGTLFKLVADMRQAG
jgi:hypothetical protein